MTAARSYTYNSVSRANWLGRYLKVERDFDTDLKDVLSDALSGVDAAFTKITGDKFSDHVRRAQLSQSNRALREIIQSVFRNTGDIIRDHRENAAMAAIDAGLFEQKSILARIFQNPTDRIAYAKSLRQTGKRNIESLLTRVFETERPLSAKVYKSEALANGLVSKTINRALARGASAEELARDVRALIDPNVPGGVSYAAKRLGRTEINNAFHAQSIRDAQQCPWINQMEWNLSKVHESDPGDECEDYAQIRLFNVDMVPEKPHPNCRCYVVGVEDDWATIENKFATGELNDYLDEVMGFEPEKTPPLPPPNKRKVEWTGPKVEKPVIDTYLQRRIQLKPARPYDILNWEVTDDIENTWLSTSFDDFKGPMRRGAQSAQAVGYDGMDYETKVRIHDLREKHPSISGIPETGERPDDLLEEYGKEIVARAVHGKKTTDTIYRGLRLSESEFTELQGSQAISLPLSSFADNSEVGYEFARGAGWLSKEASPEENQIGVLLELEKGAKTAQMEWGEKVSFGQFWINGVKYDSNDGLYHVRIKQYSMLEAVIDDIATGAASGTRHISEIDFIPKAIEAAIEEPVKIVRWTGPKVDKPMHFEWERLSDSIAYDWKMPTWDQNKEFIREGVRDVQLNGYTPDDTMKRSLAQKISHIPTEGWEEMDDAAKEALRAEGREVAATAIESLPYRDTHFYRGMRLTPEQIETMSAGDEISMEASSFTENESMALGFAGHPKYADWAWTSRDIPPNSEAVIYEILPGSKVAEIPELYGAAPEVGAFGKFDVVEIVPGGQEERVIRDYSLDDKGVYQPNYVTWKRPTRIVLRQTSLIESTPAASTTAAAETATKPIDGITVIKRPKSKGYVSKGVYGGGHKKRMEVAADVTTGNELSEFMDQVLGINPVGIDSFSVTPSSAKSVARVGEELNEKFPHVQVRQVDGVDMFPKYYGMTHATNVDPSGIVQFGFGSRMELNTHYFGDDREFTNRMVEDVTPIQSPMGVTLRWHHIGSEIDPAGSVYRHEFAHALQNALGSQGLTGHEMMEGLTKEYSRTVVSKPRKPAMRPGTGKETKEQVAQANQRYREAQQRYADRLAVWEGGFREWLQTTSGYSFKDINSFDSGFIDEDEFLAESFEAGERLGEEAPAPARVVHRMLIDRYHKVFDPVDRKRKKRLEEIARQIARNP